MDEQVEVKDYVNMDPNEVYADTASTWANVLQQHRDAGYTDSQITNKFDNSNWINGNAYNKWRNEIDANHVDFIAGLNTDKANQKFNPKPNNIGDFSNNIVTNNDMFKAGNNTGGNSYDVNSNFDEGNRIKELREQFSNNNEFRKAASEEGIELAAKGSMMNIQEAYLNGHINKGERNYLILDAIQTAMSNAGNTLMNIAAAYTGGSGNNPTNQKAMWQDRMKGVNEAQASAMQRNVEDSTQAMERKLSEQDLSSKQLANELTNKKLTIPREYQKLLENADTIDNPLLKTMVKGSALSLLNSSVNGTDVDLPTIITNMVASGGNELAEAAKKAGKSPEQFVMDSIKEVVGGGAGGSLVDPDKRTVTEGNFYVYDVNPLTGTKTLNTYESLNKMKSEGYLDGTPYETLDFGKAFNYAKKHDGYTGSKDINLLRWLEKRYKDKGFYKAEAPDFNIN